MKPEGFCTLCGVEVPQFAGLMKCPHCGTTCAPCSFQHQVDVTVNIHELQLLCSWAENFALAHDECEPGLVYAIAKRLQRQLPEQHRRLLTIGQQLAALQRVAGQQAAHPDKED